MSDDILDLMTVEDATFDLEIMGRKDGKEVSTGVVFHIRDLDNTDSQKALKKVNDVYLGKRLKTGDELSDEDTGRMFFVSTTDPTDEMLAHCITGWEFNGKKLGKYKTEFSYENALLIIKDLPWIREQVRNQVVKLRDFTKA